MRKIKLRKDHDEIVKICKTALTFTEVEGRLKISSPNTNLRRYIKCNKIEMPMYEGQRFSIRAVPKNRIVESDLHENSLLQSGTVKRFLIRNGLKKEACEECGWCKRRQSDNKIPVQLHHINGDSSDNRIENLQILCPSCHSLTPNYSGKNKKNPKRRKETTERNSYYSEPKYICENCGKLGYGEKYCSSECMHEKSRKVIWPAKEQLEKEIEIFSWVALGKKYNVSDNAIRKWARHYGIMPKK